MKELSKILLRGLPPAVEKALLEQLAAMPELVVLPEENVKPGEADLIVHAERHKAEAPPAVPALPIDTAKPLRLGVVLRQLRQILDEPALYLDAFNIGPYRFSPPDRSLSHAGAEDIALTDKETDILVYLARRGGTAVGRDELLRHVWRYQDGIDTHTLETHIYRLRQKIEVSAEAPALLLTAEGGYALKA